MIHNVTDIEEKDITDKLIDDVTSVIDNKAEVIDASYETIDFAICYLNKQ